MPKEQESHAPGDWVIATTNMGQWIALSATLMPNGPMYVVEIKKPSTAGNLTDALHALADDIKSNHTSQQSRRRSP